MNNTINCLVIDDEPVARKIIRNYSGHLPFLNIVAECSNALEAKEKLSAGGIDLLFLDIHMPVLNGIGFLNTLNKPPQVIFTTAYQEYAVNAFELAACDYLVKPFSLERFIVAVDRAKEKCFPLLQVHDDVQNNLTTQDYLLIKADGKLFKVSHADCLYAEAQANYTRVVTIDKVLSTKMSFTDFISLLPPESFTRIHRSFVINIKAINFIEGNRVFIGDKEVPIASNYKSAFLIALGMK